MRFLIHLFIFAVIVGITVCALNSISVYIAEIRPGMIPSAVSVSKIDNGIYMVQAADEAAMVKLTGDSIFCRWRGRDLSISVQSFRDLWNSIKVKVSQCHR